MTDPSGSETTEKPATGDLNVPESLGKIFERMKQIPARPAASDDDSAKKAKTREHEWQRLRSKLGRRYAECTFETFVPSDDKAVAEKQEAARERLRAYVADLKANIRAGRNVVLYGPPGTGKDHLLVAMLRDAVASDVPCDWVNGMSLFEKRRDAIDTDIREKDILAEYVKPAVLAISDPVPPWGDLQQGQAEFLFRLIDQRYRQLKPVWISANVASGKDAEKRIGTQVIDRLRDGGIAVEFAWPSFRKVVA